MLRHAMFGHMPRYAALFVHDDEAYRTAGLDVPDDPNQAPYPPLSDARCACGGVYRVERIEEERAHGFGSREPFPYVTGWMVCVECNGSAYHVLMNGSMSELISRMLKLSDERE